MSIRNFLLKYINKEEYQELKNKQRIKNDKKIFIENFKDKLKSIHEKILKKKSLNFLHSGHAADIVNVLPVIKELSNTHECNFYININKPIKFYYKHSPLLFD